MRTRLNGRVTLPATFLFAIATLLLAACATTEPENFRPRLSSLQEPVLSAADLTAEVAFGRRVAAAILGRYEGLDDEAVQRYVNLVGNTLAQSARRPELDYYFYVLESSQINAYAAPGGYVFITSAALALMQDEAELAAVLAHEIAHVDQRHIVRALDIGATENSAGLSQLLGGASETTRVVFSQAVDQALNILFEEGLQVADELEADNQAVFMLAAAGYDPGALSRFLTRMADGRTEALAQVHSTHPPFDHRLSELDSLMLASGLTAIRQARMTERFNGQVSD